MVKNLNAKLSVKPENVKKKTIRYSKRKARAKNSTIATNPFGAVHLKIRRFHRSSEATITHPKVVSIHPSIIFLRILLRIIIVLLMLTRFLLISAKCLAVGNEDCEFKIQREVWNKKMLRRVYLFSLSPKSSGVFSVKIRVGTSM